MDTILTSLRENTLLQELLKDPSVQETLAALLEQEQLFEERQRAYERNREQRACRSQKGSAGIPNPNSAPLSPLEKLLIEGATSPQQQAIRLLLKEIQGDI